MIGLGNPGPRYRHTRHNVGFEWIDAVVQGLSLNSNAFSEKFESLWLNSEVEGKEVHFLKPQTFMNNSGQAFLAWRNKFQGDARFLVVLDDLDLPLGRVRYRANGSDGGHRGMRSILGAAQTSEIPRLRIGIGKPEGSETVDYVLDRFDPDEAHLMKKVLHKGPDQFRTWLTANPEEVMNKINGARFSDGT